MSNQKPTLPSEQLQSVLNLFEKHLKNGVDQAKAQEHRAPPQEAAGNEQRERKR